MADLSTEQLLVHAGWLRGLARRLVRDDDVADDLTQETWEATMNRTPEDAATARSWLAKVMLNRLRMRRRGDGRREAREQATLLIEDAEVPTQDELVARAEMQQKLVELVLRLDEPYRSTVLLHYCEGVPLASIARTQGVPASTVRWRLKTALEQLREGLDEPSRKQWAVLLAIPKGALVAQKTSKLVAIVAVLLLLLVGGIWIFGHRGGRDAATSRTAASGAGSGGATHLTGAGTPLSLGADPDRPAWLIQPDVKPRRVAGRVTFGGNPVEGATVELASLATESGLGTPQRRTTTATGEFDFGPQPAMELSVRASAAHRSSAMLAVDMRSPLVRSDRLELALGACSVAMFGTVRDASGGAIAKARLARIDVESHGGIPGGPSVTADDNGAYELCAETRWPPVVTVEVSAAGYGTIVSAATVPGRVKVDFALVPEATIVGHVIRDDTREPVAQAYVYIPAGPNGAQRTGSRGTFTDASGHFRIDRVAPGSQLVFARGDGMADSVRGVPVVLEAGQTSQELEIRLEVGSTIRGKVVADGKPVAGSRIMTSGRTAYSQADGTYVLTSVPRGEVAFSASPYGVIKPTTFHVYLPFHDGVTLEVEPLGTITGVVTRNRAPIAGAAVYLKGPNTNELDPVTTDATGHFTASGLRAGPWQVDAGSQELGAFGVAPQIVQLAHGQTVDITIDMKYGASISGRVVDQNGAPVPGLTVAFIHTAADDVGIGVTATDGSFRAATMTGGGKYRPNVSMTPTAGPAQTPLRPASGTEFPLIALENGDSAVTGVVLAVRLDRLSISGTVVDSDGAPIPDVRVVAELVEDNVRPQFFPGMLSPTTTSDVDGHFTINDLVDGTYALRGRSPAGLDGTLLDVRAGRSGITLVLPSAGGIEATFAGFKTTPQLTALSSGAHYSSPPLAGTVQGNVATFGNVTPGTYLVTARTSTEGVSQLVEVAEGKTSRVTLTSKGSGVVAGHVREFRSGKPIEGMTCHAVPRVGITQPMNAAGDGVRTDAQGGFMLDAPVGDIAVWCDGLWSQFSDGMRMVTLTPTQRLDIDVPVVGRSYDGGPSVMSNMGADFDYRLLVPSLVTVKPGGPAATAGFANGDVITAVEDKPVAELSPRGVWLLIVSRVPGTSVKVAATRAGKTVTGNIVLAPTQ